MSRPIAALALVFVPYAFAPAAHAMETSLGELTVTPVVEGLEAPWSFGFLPDDGILITEREGRLLHLSNGEITPITGLPRVAAVGQGGLLDLLVPRDFAESRTLFFTFAKQQGAGAGTAVARAVLPEGGQSLEGVEVIYEIAPSSTTGRHFGSRIVEAKDGTLFITVGDRGLRPSAQDRSVENGSVLRITKDGSIPDDNPFVGDATIKPAIYSYGHRNPQGATLGADGQLWITEHGAMGGDELNRIEAGVNYGWPVISYGQHYSGRTIGEGTAKEGMAQPVTYWDPSIAPSGLAYYSGAAFRDWQSDLFAGSLKFDYIARLSGNPYAEVEKLQSPETLRVRDVRQGPDGGLWFLSVGHGALYRITPE